MAEMEFAKRGVGNTALGLSIGALGAQLLGGGLSNLLGGAAVQPAAVVQPTAGGCCNEDHLVNRYEAAQAAEIAELKTEIKLRDANTYTLGEVEKLRNYFEGKFDQVEHQLCDQRVYNATNTATVSCIGQQINGLQAALAAITKTVVPKDAICPQVMERYNSWTAPTGTETATTNP